MKKLRRAMALILTTACLTAGVSASAQQTSEEDMIVLPEPAAEEENMLLGDGSTAESQDVTLYFAAEGSTTLSSVTRSVRVEKGKTLIESILEQLFDQRTAPVSAAAGAGEAQLADCEQGRGIVTVNLSLGSNAQLSEQARLLRCIAIANTLLGVDGVEAVNVLAGDRSDSVAALPTGTFTRQYEGSTALYAQFQSEQESFLSSGGDVIARNVVLYFPTADGYFLPELRSVTFNSSNYAATLLRALEQMPEEAVQCLSPIPESEDKLYDTPTLRITEAGERVVDLNLSSVLMNYLAFSGMEAWQLYGSVTLSLCSFVPDLDGVQFWIDGARVSECSIGERTLRFGDGIARRSDFSPCIGGSAGMYFSDEQGNLRRLECAMRQADAVSPLGVLRAMIGVAAPDGMQSVFPEDVYGDDILGVGVERGVATVNLSGGFYTRCQSLNAAQERNMIYAMVNALCELSGVGAVRFIVEGMALESLSQNIYLKTALLPDCGLVVDGAALDAEPTADPAESAQTATE